MSRIPSDENLEKWARIFRKKVGIEFVVRPDVMTIIYKINSRDVSFSYRRVPKKEFIKGGGYYDSKSNSIGLPIATIASANSGDAHARMVVCHEVSHYLLDHQGRRNRIPGRKSSDIADIEEMYDEIAANKLAAILLCPEYLVPDDFDALLLMSEFGLSKAAADIRYKEILDLRRKRRGEVRPLPKSVVQFLESRGKRK